MNDFYYSWKQCFLEQNKLSELKSTILKSKPKWICIDTETTGLDIINDKPFLFIISFSIDGKTGHSYAFEYNTDFVKWLLLDYVPNNCLYLIGANIKYDLHMILNTGINIDFNKLYMDPEKCLICDTQTLIRLTQYTDEEKSLALKKACIDIFGYAVVDDEETIIKEIKTNNQRNITKLYNAKLKEYKKNVTIEKLKKAISLNEIVEPALMDIYNSYLKDIEVDYQKIYQSYPNEMIKYALKDGVLTLELFTYLLNKLEQRYNQKARDIKVWLLECVVIPVYLKGERVGLKVDTDLIKTYKKNLQIEMKKYSNEFKELTGLDFTQTTKLLIWFSNELQEQQTTISHNVLQTLINSKNPKVKRASELLLLLRNIHKKLNTELQNLIENISSDNRIHLQNKSSGTKTGRISGAFQQYSKEGFSIDGKELVNIRKCIITDNKPYSTLCFYDFSQMELRIQAEYTIKINHPDYVLLSAYVPVNCFNRITKKKYKLTSVDDAGCAYTVDRNNNSIWIDRANNYWIPTDLHTHTAAVAFGKDRMNNLKKTNEKEYKKLRGYAKTVNFSIQYGAGLKALFETESLKSLSKENIMSLYNGYKTSFTGVEAYNRWVDDTLNKNNFTIENLFGRKYFLKYSKQYYKVYNYLIQGSCADYVKQLGYQIDMMLYKNKYESRLIYSIHDEWIIEISDNDPKDLPKIIQNEINKLWKKYFKVPVICELSTTKTNWYNKKENVI